VISIHIRHLALRRPAAAMSRIPFESFSFGPTHMKTSSCSCAGSLDSVDSDESTESSLGSATAGSVAGALDVVVLGLGYVGSVTAACFARQGHQVTGIDVNQSKVDKVSRGEAPVSEPGLGDLMRAGREAGRLLARTNGTRALSRADVISICVGTPSKADGSLDLGYVEQVCRDIGAVLENRSSYCVILVRSTLFGGSCRNLLIPILEAESGKKAGVDFGFCFNPEFLREGSALRDFDDPPYTVIGELDQRSGDLVAPLCEVDGADLLRVELEVAEMVKYACNSFHAMKVVFANEIGNLCKEYGVDGRSVMEIFARDTKLNLSPRYLQPGFAFGGSCLPKDVRAMISAARSRDLPIPMIEAVLASNELHLDRAYELVAAERGKSIGMVGLSFKAHTDDLRESPAVALAARLLEARFDLTIFDPDVSPESLVGSNLDFAEMNIGTASGLMCSSLDEFLGRCEVVVISKWLSADHQSDLVARLNSSHQVIDLVGTPTSELQSWGVSFRGLVS
jgi:GDP-mannose 6-dehydrogenase